MLSKKSTLKLISALVAIFHTVQLASQINAPAPSLVLHRDDHVVTVEMDYNAFAGWGYQLWDVGNDGTDACGYVLRWWPDPAHAHMIEYHHGCESDHSAGTNIVATEAEPYVVITSNPIVQIQPLANNVKYHLKVEKLNGLGQVCSPPTVVEFMGGDPTRVNELRTSLTFFDDFNLHMGPADEKKWNNAMGPQTDPRFNLFFINHQCHVHSLNGTTNDGAGDKSQTAQRTRKPMLIEATGRRKIVFDMDGIFSGRSVWYLDFNPVNTDLTGHLSFFDFDGDTGLPADVCRIKANGHGISVNLINDQGASFKVAEAHLPEFGRAMMTNVRRSFDVRLGTDGIQIFVDGTEVINAPFPPGAFKQGIYYPLWSAVGYNTSKDDVPYFLSHWDNFGFDGPDVQANTVHNYVTRIMGTDLQKTYREWNGDAFPADFTIEVPDDLHPLVANVANEVYLVWSYQKNDYSSFSIGSQDSFYVNGMAFKMPPGGNNSSPSNPSLVDYSGSTISNRVKIDEVILNGSSLINPGMNNITFIAQNTGIMNVHLEVFCPASAPEPPYTPPAAMHHFVHHGALAQTGPSAKIVFFNGLEFDQDDDGNFFYEDTLSGLVPVEVLVGNHTWANWSPQSMHIPNTSAELWTVGSIKGIKNAKVFLRKKEENAPLFEMASLNTSTQFPTPQLRYLFQINTATVPDGAYEMFVQAEGADGTLSHPAYHGFGFKFDVDELSGAYTPINVTIHNALPAQFTFNGDNGGVWTTDGSWDTGNKPPIGYNGNIIIDANCEVPALYNFVLGPAGQLLINNAKTLRVK